MNATPVPARPLFFCMVGVGMIAGSIWYSMQPSPQFEFVEFSVPNSLEEDNPAIMRRYHDNVLTIEASETVMKRSGFAPDRTPYSRSIQSSASVVTKPDYDPQFVGTMGRASGLKVLVVWKAGEQPLTHLIGDETPWGVLVEASSAQLIFERDGVRKTLSMF